MTREIVQIGRLNGGVLIYSPYGFRPVERLGALSRKGVAAAFTTTVELDTSIGVARNGQQIREFDPFFFDEEAPRDTRRFRNSPHPTYVLTDKD